MTDADALSRALAWGLARHRADAPGKTLLAGWRGDRCLFALGAGLGGESDRERFGVLARYLLRRDHADGYWLVFPADLDGVAQLAAETCHAGLRRVGSADLPEDGEALGGIRELGASPQLGELLDGGGTLPALMRRELDRLAAALALAPP